MSSTPRQCRGSSDQAVPFLRPPAVCMPPTEPENGGYRCHPSPCHRLAQKTVIEYFCDEGYALKGDYKFLTCQNGEWDAPMQITCRLSQGEVLGVHSAHQAACGNMHGPTPGYERLIFFMNQFYWSPFMSACGLYTYLTNE